MTGPTPQIPSEGRALRQCRLTEVNAKGAVRKSVFMPRAEGQDRDGLSVSIEDAVYRELHRRKFTSEGRCACSILVGDIREAKPLDVVADGEEADPKHALIVGFPDRTQSSGDLAAAEALARRLAQKASLYDFPDTE